MEYGPYFAPPRELRWAVGLAIPGIYHLYGHNKLSYTSVLYMSGLFGSGTVKSAEGVTVVSDYSIILEPESTDDRMPDRPNFFSLSSNVITVYDESDATLSRAKSAADGLKQGGRLPRVGRPEKDMGHLSRPLPTTASSYDSGDEFGYRSILQSSVIIYPETISKCITVLIRNLMVRSAEQEKNRKALVSNDEYSSDQSLYDIFRRPSSTHSLEPTLAANTVPTRGLTGKLFKSSRKWPQVIPPTDTYIYDIYIYIN